MSTDVEQLLPVTITAPYTDDHVKVLSAAKELCRSLERTVEVVFQVALHLAESNEVTGLGIKDAKLTYTLSYNKGGYSQITDVVVREL